MTPLSYALLGAAALQVVGCVLVEIQCRDIPESWDPAYLPDSVGALMDQVRYHHRMLTVGLVAGVTVACAILESVL